MMAACILLLSQCATRGRITGGPRDETPPQIILEESTPNQQTNFEVQPITITFDEWVQLKDPINQILISPPTERNGKTRVKGKSVIFEFHEDEVLRENATYSINFGEAIQDLNESNAVTNFSFVFSTGTSIDSLSLEGKVIDALTGEPVENATVMLYEDTADSVVTTKKPFYANRTSKSGDFTITNVKEGEFKVAAIQDANLNYKWDPASEPIAFLDSLVSIDASQVTSLRLVMSQPDGRLQRDRPDTTGWNTAIFAFNREPHSVEVTSSLPDQNLHVALENNTLWAYYPPSPSPFDLYFSEDLTGWTDTVRLSTNALPPTSKLARKSKWRNSFHVADPIKVCVDRPMISLDTSLIRLESGGNVWPATVEIFDSIPFCLELESNWQADSTYDLTILPDALTGIGGVTNDTITERFPIANPDRFGNMIVTVGGLNPDYNYVMDILKDNGKSQYTFASKGRSTVIQEVEHLKPGKFKLRIIEDANNNGRWDAADYLKKRQAEAIQEIALEELRANWDLEVDHKWK